MVDLDFGTRGEAEAFLRFLTAQVWGIPQNAPALAGSPQTMILEPPRAPLAGAGPAPRDKAMADVPRWRLSGDWFDVCKCTIPCPCYFAQSPTFGD